MTEPDDFDWRGIFARELHRLIVEVFEEEYGIDELDEDTFEELVTSITRQHFFQIRAETRRACGIRSSLDGFRFRSVTPLIQMWAHKKP